jgi:class 3 adenylate cyclase
MDFQRRQRPVLFCDQVGPTAIAGRLGPEKWRELHYEAD